MRLILLLQKLCEKEANYSEDEGVDSAGSHCDSPGPQCDPDAKRLEYLLENGFHWNTDEAAHLKYQASRLDFSFSRDYEINFIIRKKSVLIIMFIFFLEYQKDC